MNFFKAIGIAMAVLSNVAAAMDPNSEGGANITINELVRISIRSGLAAAQSLDAKLSGDLKGVATIVAQELKAGGVV